MTEKQRKSETSSNEYKALLQTDPAVLEPVRWLEKNGHDPDANVAVSLKRLKKAGRHLPWDRKLRYAKKIILSTFFTEWVKKHRGKTQKQIAAADGMFGEELRVLKRTIIVLADEKCFERVAPTLAKTNTAGSFGIPLGDGLDFAGYAATQVDTIASKFISNFDADRPGAERGAAKYIEKVAVSHYLRSVTKPTVGPPPGVFAYLIDSKRISERSVMAFKVRHFPDSLTQAEQDSLRNDYGYTGPLRRRFMVKELASILGYRNGPALSKKLHKIKKWFEGSEHAACLDAAEEDWS